MIEKILIPAATTALGLGLALVTPQDEPEKPAPASPAKAEAKTEEWKVADASEALSDVYERLRRIRAERLSDRPKELADEAAKLYRQAVGAVNEGQDVKARSLTDAARELTRALEVSLRSRRDEASDPDLPPPPRRGARRVYVYTTGDKITGLPPAIDEGEGRAGTVVVQGKNEQVEAKEIRISSPSAVTATGAVRVRSLGGEGSDGKRDVIVERRIDGAPVVGYRLPEKVQYRALDAAKGDRDQAEVELRKATEALRLTQEGAKGDVAAKHSKEIEALHEALKAAHGANPKIAIELHAEALNKLKKQQAELQLHEKLTGTHTAVDVNGLSKFSFVTIPDKPQGGPAGAEEATAALRKAYEAVIKARKERKGDDGKVYLDAAKDLYNTARKEAEAKHFDRAAELARAAEAITKVNQAVGTVRVETRVVDGKAETKVFRDGAPSETFKSDVLRYHVVPKHDAKEGEKTETKREVRIYRTEPDKDAKTKGGDGKGEGKKSEQTFQFKLIDPKQAGGDQGEAEKADKDDAGPVQGIGVMIRFEDGKILVEDLMPNGPAAKDGRIKSGDSILGVITKSGAAQGFADKELPEVTKILRGPSGSKVKVLVQPKGAEDVKIYQIERKKLDLPNAEEGKPADAKPAGGNLSLPPIIE